jgi:hypothetical protein
LITSDDAIASVEVIESAYAALNQNRWTTIPSTNGLPKSPVAVPA